MKIVGNTVGTTMPRADWAETDEKKASFIKNKPEVVGGKDGTSVTVTSVSESTEDGGANVVTFSDGKTLSVKNGSRGSDGHTPVKDVDYFDGKDGKDGTSVTIESVTESEGGTTVAFSDGNAMFVKNGRDGTDGYSPVKGTDYFDGEDGKDGYSPVKGTDYWTPEDQEAIKDETLGWANEFDVTSHIRITSYGMEQTIHKATDNGSTIVIHAEGDLEEGSLYITGLTGTPVAMLLFDNDTVGAMTFSGNKSLEDFTCSQDSMVLDPETGEWVESFWKGVNGRFTFVLFYTADGVRMLKGEDGHTPVKGTDYFDGKDGTSVTITSVTESEEDYGSNVVEFSDGKTLSVKNGSKGADGHTPVKDVDYFDGKDGITPVKGKDYWTAEDLQQMVTDTVNGVLAKKGDILKVAYPVGSIYISAVSTNPSTLFGFGTWEQIQNKFLLAAGSSYTAGSTGGSASHTHKYKVGAVTYWGAVVGKDTDNVMTYDYSANKWSAASKEASQPTITTTKNKNLTYEKDEITAGFNSSESNVSTTSNLPPYIAVYVWKRTA